MAGAACKLWGLKVTGAIKIRHSIEKFILMNTSPEASVIPPFKLEAGTLCQGSVPHLRCIGHCILFENRNDKSDTVLRGRTAVLSLKGQTQPSRQQRLLEPMGTATATQE